MDPSTGDWLLARCADLALCSEEGSTLTRRYLTDAHRRAGELIQSWMRDAGMHAEFDALGNVIGRYAGATADAPVIMMGSHIDTVRNAGRFDGMLGVVSAIACVKALHDANQRLGCAIEVIGFGDEEGVRFGVTMIGSAAMAGRFDPAWLDVMDRDGVTMREALEKFDCAADEWPTLRRDFAQVKAYLELHIEQGPVLLNRDLPVGVVTAISGSSKISVAVSGKAGHAGTVPMDARQDALMAAAEMMLAGEALAKTSEFPLVCTTGKAEITNGAINVIPGNATFTFDIRSGEDAVRKSAVGRLEMRVHEIARRRGVEVSWLEILDLPAAPCDSQLQHQFAHAIAARSFPVVSLPSGAGHDAMSFSGRVPIGMVFVRCGNGGISHHPAETVSAADVGVGAAVLLETLVAIGS